MTQNISINHERYIYSKPTLVLNVLNFQKHAKAHRFKALAMGNKKLLLKRQLSKASVIQHSLDDLSWCPDVMPLPESSPYENVT